VAHRSRLSAAVLVVAGLLLTLSPGHADAAARAGADKPAVGTCYQLAAAGVADRTNPGTVVPCSQQHTAMTYASADVPSSVSMTDSAQLGRFVSKTCDPAYHRTVSRSISLRLMTAYYTAYYTSSKADQAAGHRWIECVVVLAGGPHDLVPLPGTTTPFVPDARGISRREARCLTGVHQYLTSCSRPHDYRATGDFQLAKGPYPSERARYRADAAHCSRLSRQWLAINPTAAVWRTGFHYTVCYRPGR
jgi:hypothetical protein